MAPKRKYTEGEKILCYHGPLLYEAKCLQVDLDGKQAKYLVHYNGWNKNWDEWVGESRMLKYVEANLQKQQELKKQYTKDKKPRGKVRIKKESISDKEDTSPVIKKETESSEKKKCSIQESFSIDKNKSPKGNIILKKKVIVTITKDKDQSLSTSETKKTVIQKKSEKQTQSKTDSATKVKKGKDDGQVETVKKVIAKTDKGTPKQSSIKSDSVTKIKKPKDDSTGSAKKEVKKMDKLKQTTHKETVKQTSVKKEHPVKVKKEKDEDSSTNKEVKKKPDKEKQIAQKEAQKQISVKKVLVVKIKKEVDEPKEEKSAIKEIKRVSADKGKQILKGETLKQGISENKVSTDETAKKKCAEKLTEIKEETTVQPRKSQRQSVLEKYKTNDDKAAQLKSVKSKTPAKEILGDQTKSSKQKSKHGGQNLDNAAKNSLSQKHSAKKRSRHSPSHMVKKKRWKRLHRRRKRTHLKNKKFPKEGARFEVMFKFPQSLTNWIIDDWHQVNELKKLLHLPARITADHFIEVYRRLKIKLLMLDENSDRHLIVEATCNGLRNHFNTILGNRLLYRFERIQYADILEKFKDIPKCKIYGAIHLLRMLSSMEKYITENSETLTDIQLITLNKSVQDFITVMEKPFQYLLCADDYEVASPEYHRRALI